MQASLDKLLNVIGLSRVTGDRRKTLGMIIGVSLLAHIFALVVFGSVVLIRAIMEEKTVFTAPPPVKTYEPRKLEHKVKVSKRQRSSSRPAVLPRLVSARSSAISLPEIQVDPKVVKTSFQPKFKAVSGTGLGAGLGTGYGLGGFGAGVSAFDFFGIRGRGDKIAILVDVSVSMVEDEKGGFKGFDRVRGRINQVVDALAEQALFNLVAFADAAQTFRAEMIPATEDNKRAAKDFMSRYNVSENQMGLTSGNVQAVDTGVIAAGGTTRLDLALTAAFQQGADTILIISDGLPRVAKGLTAEQQTAWAARLQQWQEQNKAAIEAYNQAAATAEYEERKVWVPPSGGGGVKEGAGGPTAGHWATQRVPKTPLPPRPQPPQMPDDMQWWSLKDFIAHFGKLHELNYVKKGKKIPIVHAIGYAIDNAGGDFLKDFTKQYKGSYRRVGKIN